MFKTPAHYEYIRAKLKDCDPAEISLRSGTAYNPETQEFTLQIMRKTYIVRYPSGEIFNEAYTEITDFPAKTLILRYLIHAEGTLPTGIEITYREVPWGQIYYENFYGRCVQRLARIAARDMAVFEKVMVDLGGVSAGHGDCSYRFQFLNHVYLTFIFWQGDDEFPPSANILFDHNVSYYFDAEDLAVVGDVANVRLQSLMNQLMQKS